jgi:hypothetical protein
MCLQRGSLSAAWTVSPAACAAPLGSCRLPGRLSECTPVTRPQSSLKTTTSCGLLPDATTISRPRPLFGGDLPPAGGSAADALWTLCGQNGWFAPRRRSAGAARCISAGRRKGLFARTFYSITLLGAGQVARREGRGRPGARGSGGMAGRGLRSSLVRRPFLARPPPVRRPSDSLLLSRGVLWRQVGAAKTSDGRLLVRAGRLIRL